MSVTLFAHRVSTSAQTCNVTDRDESNYVVTTDMGNEFRGLQGALPEGVVHRQKDPTDRNATAMVEL